MFRARHRLTRKHSRLVSLHGIMQVERQDPTNGLVKCYSRPGSEVLSDCSALCPGSQLFAGVSGYLESAAVKVLKSTLSRDVKDRGRGRALLLCNPLDGTVLLGHLKCDCGQAIVAKKLYQENVRRNLAQLNNFYTRKIRFQIYFQIAYKFKPQTRVKNII